MSQKQMNQVDLKLDEKVNLLFNKDLWFSSFLNDYSSSQPKDIISLNDMVDDLKVMSLIANSWDISLIKEYGKLLAMELKHQGKQYWSLLFGEIDHEGVKTFGFDSIFDQIYYANIFLAQIIEVLKEAGIQVIAYCPSKLSKFAHQIIDGSNIDVVVLKKFPYRNIEHKLMLIEILEDDHIEYHLYHPMLDDYTSAEDFKKTLSDLEDENDLLDTINDMVKKIKSFVPAIYSKIEFNQDDDLKELSEEFYRKATIGSSVLYKKIITLCQKLSNSVVSVIGNFIDYAEDAEQNEELLKSYFPKIQSIHSGMQSYLYSQKQVVKDSKKVKSVIVKIDREDTLSDAEVNFIRKLEQAYSIILIVSPRLKIIEHRWEKYCSMILATELFNASSLKGLYDILTGRQASGQLVKSIRRTYHKNGYHQVYYGLANEKLKFYDYSKNDQQISFSVLNKDSEEVNVVYKMYAWQENKDMRKRQLISFKKSVIPAGYSDQIKLLLNASYFRGNNISSNDIEVDYFSETVIKSRLKRITQNNNHKGFLSFIQNLSLFNLNIFFVITYMLVLISSLSLLSKAIIGGVIVIINLLIINLKTVASDQSSKNINSPVVDKEDQIPEHKEKQSDQNKVTEIKETKNIDMYSFIADIVEDAVKSLETAEAIDVYAYPKDMVDDKTLDLDDETLEEETIEDQVKVEEQALYDLDEDMEIEKPEVIIDVESYFDQIKDMNDYLQHMIIYMKKNGLVVEESTIRNIFASMAGSRFLVSLQKTYKITHRFIEVLGDYLGAFVFQGDLRDPDDSLIQCLESAVENPKQIHLMVLDQVDLSSEDPILQKLFDFAADPYLSHEIELSDEDETYPIADNIWFIIQTQSIEENAPIKLNFGGISFNLNLTFVKPLAEVEANPSKMTYYFFMEYISGLRDKYYLDESMWKKMDAVSFIFTKGHLDNRIIRTIEAYTSMFLSFGDNAYEAIDHILTHLLLPRADKDHYKDELNGDKDVLSLFDQVLGLENLIFSKQILTGMNQQLLEEGEN